MVKKFHIRGFRNLHDDHIDISGKLIIFQGNNAQGKTNVLEAMSIAACGSSFRTHKKDLWLPFDHENEHFAELVLTLAHDQKGRVVIARSPASERVQSRFWINDVPTSYSDYVGHQPIIAFRPEDMNLFYLDKELRRDFLDNVLLQTSKQYKKAFLEAKKALMNRNRLLKLIAQGKSSDEELQFWNTMYKTQSDLIQKERQHVLEFLQKQVQNLYHDFSGHKLALQILYKPSVFDSTGFIDIEKKRGFSLSGQHRDDFDVVSEGRSWANVASRGEMRTLILALKSALLGYISEHTEKKPIVLLDDVLSEFDESRKSLILGWSSDYQLFLSVAGSFPFPKHAQVFEVKNGQIVSSRSDA